VWPADTVTATGSGAGSAADGAAIDMTLASASETRTIPWKNDMPMHPSVDTGPATTVTPVTLVEKSA